MIILLVALDAENKLFIANKKLSKNQSYYCPSCKSKVFLKIGEIMCPHFAHYKKSDCQVFSEGETAEHLKGKLALADYFKTNSEEVQLEAYLPELKQRPDILIKNNKRKIAIEFQCSSISIEKINQRTDGYLKAGYDVLWILGKNFQYKNGLTSLDKACLYFNLESRRFLLFHYDVNREELIISYDYQLNNSGKMLYKKELIKISQQKKISLEKANPIPKTNNQLKWTIRKQEELIKNTRYPSGKMLEFLSLIYKNGDNIISIPKEIFQNLAHEWMIQTFHMAWKYQIVLWLEDFLIKEIITIKMLKEWLRKRRQREEIIFYNIQKLDEKQMLKVIIEFFDLLVERKILKSYTNQKWTYEKAFKRFKNLEEKYYPD